MGRGRGRKGDLVIIWERRGLINQRGIPITSVEINTGT
jgi:hypothetical protein